MCQPFESDLILKDEYYNIFNTASDAFIIYDLETGLVVEANIAACQMYGYLYEELIGLDPVVFMQPERYLVFREYIQHAKAGDVLEALFIHTHRDGSLFHVEVRKSLLQYHGRACLLSAIRDVSKRIQTEKILSDQIEARRYEQAILLAISHTLASTLELQPGLILEQLREIIHYTHGVIFELENATLLSLAMVGSPQLQATAPLWIQTTPPETLTVLFNAHRPLRIPDVWSADDPKAQFLRELLGEATNLLLTGIRSWMWVPLAVRGRIIGCMGLAESSAGYFTSHHADLALSVANQAAITMINTELYGQAQALAVLEERQNLARSLHDAVNQSLFSAGLIAEVLPRLWDRDQPEARRSLEDLRRLTRGAQAEMRALLAELRPSTLIDSDLGDLLHLLGNALSARVGFPVTVTVFGEFVLLPEVQIVFYRVCQEALNNIAKHAKASQVDIQLTQVKTVIELVIKDDGQGFDPEQSFSGHYGLSMMHERAESVGAVLSITSKPGHGTKLSIRWKPAPTKETK